jgi:hypothetical protein
MAPSIAAIQKSSSQAKTTIAALLDRASSSSSIDDRAELSVLRTTVAKMEELLDIATEYEDILRRQLARTNARIRMTST